MRYNEPITQLIFTLRTKHVTLYTEQGNNSKNATEFIICLKECLPAHRHKHVWY